MIRQYSSDKQNSKDDFMQITVPNIPNQI